MATRPQQSRWKAGICILDRVAQTQLISLQTRTGAIGWESHEMIVFLLIDPPKSVTALKNGPGPRYDNYPQWLYPAENDTELHICLFFFSNSASDNVHMYDRPSLELSDDVFGALILCDIHIIATI